MPVAWRWERADAHGQREGHGCGSVSGEGRKNESKAAGAKKKKEGRTARSAERKVLGKITKNRERRRSLPRTRREESGGEEEESSNDMELWERQERGEEEVTGPTKGRGERGLDRAVLGGVEKE